MPFSKVNQGIIDQNESQEKNFTLLLNDSQCFHFNFNSEQSAIQVTPCDETF
jgi:hypothetical protein